MSNSDSDFEVEFRSTKERKRNVTNAHGPVVCTGLTINLFPLTVPVLSRAKLDVPDWTCHFDMGLGYLQHNLSNPYSRGAQINVWLSMWIHTQFSCLFHGVAVAQPYPATAHVRSSSMSCASSYLKVVEQPNMGRTHMANVTAKKRRKKKGLGCVAG